MNITTITLAARSARPDLPMLGVSVKMGRFNLVCFPQYGQGIKRDWFKAQRYLHRDLTAPELNALLRNPSLIAA